MGPVWQKSKHFEDWLKSLSESDYQTTDTMESS